MKKRMSKLLLALIVLSGFAVSVLGGNFDTEAADESQTYVVENYTADDASPFFKNNTAPICKTDGYIFAGWYAEDDTVVTDETTGEENFTGNPVVTLVGYMHENVKALFVEESVLDVKGQIAILDNEDGTADDGNMDVATVTDTTKANLRLVTSVDSLKYQNVGFEISYTYDETPVSTGSVTNYVYKNLTVVDGTDGAADEKMVPSEVFSKRSQYFKACTVNGVPMDAFDTDFSVRSYWVTADGATVYGSSTALNKSVQAGIYHTYEAGVDTTYYKELESAVASVAASETEATVTLFKDAEVESDMAVTGQVKVTNREGADVTIYRGAVLKGSTCNMFSTTSGSTLKVIGTTNENSIVLDGRTADGATVDGDSLIDSDTASLYIENATLRNAKNTSNNDGGAIQASGELEIKNVKFISNYSNYGAAIRTTASTTIAECVFGAENYGNTATTQGGAIYNNGTTIDIYDSQFLHNKVTTSGKSNPGRGGAIYLNSTAEINVTNTKFAHNIANKSGGAIYNGGGKMYFTATNKETNSSTLAAFEYNVANDTASAMGGGAILTGNATGVLEITGYVFRENFAAKTGGAICARNGAVTIEETQFIKNHTSGTSGHGGAIAYSYASKNTSFSVKNSIFTGNYTEGSAAHGGAVYVEDSTATTVNSDILTVNTFTGEYGLNAVLKEDSFNSSNDSDSGVYIAK